MATKVKKPSKEVAKAVEKSSDILSQRKVPRFLFYAVDQKGKGGFVNPNGELTERFDDAQFFATADAAWLSELNPNWELTLLQAV